MPEGPELSKSRDILNDRLVNRRIFDVGVLGGRYQKAPPHGMLDFQRSLVNNCDTGVIRSVNVKGKFMYWALTGDWYLWCTYGMSGAWQLERGKHAAVAVWHRSTRVGVMEDCIPAMYFNDPRHFGTLKFVKGKEALDRKLATLGPDMLNDPPSTIEFGARLNRRIDRTIAEALMDQSVVSGVGNYVKAEALYAAKLSPHRTVRSLTGPDREVLRTAIIDVMKASYELGGATISTYQNVDGSSGRMGLQFKVYDQKIDPFGDPVAKEITLDKRTTHWCPKVQT